MRRLSHVLAVLLLPTVAIGYDDADHVTISATAKDYSEGWCQGDVARMERALHPDLAKRMIYTDPATERSQLHHMDATAFIQATSKGGGSSVPGADGIRRVEILDVFENAAVVKVIGSEWVDYLHLARWNGRWLIVNVLWEFRPEYRKQFEARSRPRAGKNDE